MERLTVKEWGKLKPWECCGQGHYCMRGCHDEGGCTKGCIVPMLYKRLACYEDTELDPVEIKAIIAEIEAIIDDEMLKKREEDDEAD